LGTILNQPAFSDLDRHFARFLARLSPDAPDALALTAALVSRSRGEGHTCLDVRRLAGSRLADLALFAGARETRRGETVEDLALTLPKYDSWIHLLKESAVVGEPGNFKPLILDGHGRVYLHRYWNYESRLAEAIRERAAAVSEPLDADALAGVMERYFPPGERTEVNWQQVAAFTALTKRLCVISGGPGTGKTRTVAMLLAMLLEQAGHEPLRIALTAPTGKAAARLQESIKLARSTLPCPDAVKARLPEDASTVHRLLGSIRDSASFKHHAENPLPVDVVVVDEASMVDLALMVKLFDAVPPSARIVLLGDKDQLASVEAGAVLADLCPGEHVNEFSPEARTLFQRVTGQELPAAASGGLGDYVVELQRNYRFGSENGILALSRAVKAGDADLALRLLRERSGETGGISSSALPAESRLKERLRRRVLAGFAGVLQAPDAVTALAALGRFRILCAVRQGPFGVVNVNRLVEEILREAGLLSQRDRWYDGRPIMVLRNDYDLRLFNGDIGILRHAAESGQPRAYFIDASQELRSVPPPRLPEHETVFAMTVHKSQGSEFEEVLLLLPDRASPVLTRELIYTGISRASRRVELWHEEPVLRAALAQRVERASGLREKLWAEVD